MAQALLEAVFENLHHLEQSEFGTSSGIKEKAEKLSRTLLLIQAVLDDAEEKQMTHTAIKEWLQHFKDALYVLDDILDDCSASTESLQLGDLFSFIPKNIMVGRKLNEMIKRLDRIVEVKNMFGVMDHGLEWPIWRQTSSVIVNPQIYGRDEDIEKVVEFLLSPAQDSDTLRVYPIVGLGGIGKTTLAQAVYNDQRVSNHFELKIWVYVSDNFTILSILRSIIESTVKGKCDISDLTVMEEKVHSVLQSKRYLLVLDDVWKRKQELELGLSQDKWDKLKFENKWDKLKFVLSCGSNGASVLVSTRDKDVAAIMGTCQDHDLSGLSEGDSWSLFKQRAFRPDVLNEEEHVELVAIGKEIVQKCRGLPLAVEALGGLLSTKTTEKEWLKVNESKLWTLSGENDILRALRLSYFHLTPTLKQCFAFCAIFPKGKEIKKQDLIHLRMANGFISSRENLDVEEVGGMIWNELYEKSFFQDISINDESGDIHFKMHDLIHDLAQSITKQEFMCLEDINMVDLSRNTHHIGFGCGGQTPFNKRTCEKVESLRTFYQLEFSMTRMSGWFPKHRSLRVLCTNSFKLSLLGNLTHLRYLELHCLEIKIFPDSICTLNKLEILKVVDLWRLHHLPKRLSCLQNLRHLDISNCGSLSRMFPDIHKLSHLRTLSVYIVRREAGYSLAELCDLNLGGKLSIGGLENVGSVSEAQAANLKGKEDLRELSLSWDMSGETKSHVADVGEVLEVLQPHSNLKVLRIIYYEGLHWPSWMGNNSVLNNLISLELDRSSNCRQLPQLGKLPSLKKLKVYGMDNIQYMDDDECYDGAEVMAFPSLEELKLWGLPNLERLLKVERGVMFPCLSYLRVEDCPKLQLPHTFLKYY